MSMEYTKKEPHRTSEKMHSAFPIAAGMKV